MDELELVVRRLTDAYSAAALAKDVSALVALYDPDATIFDLWGKWEYRGAAAWRSNVTEWFGSLGAEKVAVSFDHVEVSGSDAFAVCHMYVTYQGLSATGEPLRAMNNRMTWALARSTDGTWRVIHEHSSAPVDPGTAKVILSRP